MKTRKTLTSWNIDEFTTIKLLTVAEKKIVNGGAKNTTSDESECGPSTAVGIIGGGVGGGFIGTLVGLVLKAKAYQDKRNYLYNTVP